MTPHRIQHRVQAGRWRRVNSTVYQHSAVAPTPLSRLLAVCMAYGGLASHRSAAALQGIDGYKLGRPEVTVAPGRARATVGATVHRSTQMELIRAIERDGIPCTDLARTMLDLSAVESRKQLEAAIDSVLRDRRLRYRDLYEVLASHARRGRNGVALLRAVIDSRCGDDPVPMSEWSRWVHDLLVEAGLTSPRLEYRVHGPDGRFLAQVDLAFPSRRLAIELDSVRWHHNHESFVKDRRRRNHLQASGWSVLNFTWEDYSARPAELCAVVLEAHAAAGSH